jgi:hypothetical protein
MTMQLLTKLQTFLSESLEVKLQRSIATDLEAHVLALFHTVVNSVPAYRQFLQVQGIDPASIQTLSAFQQLPLVTKANYIKQYPIAEICRAGNLSTRDMLAVSSGSTGEPTCWPRQISDELEIATRNDLTPKKFPFSIEQMLCMQHFSFDLSILLLAIALIIHTIAEVWILPAYQKVQSDWQSVVLARALFLDNVPILSERSVLLWLVFKSVTSQSFLRL